MRPRIDFSLTEQRISLAIDALRAGLGTDAVFTTPADYRAEIARRFFGDADPSGYLGLLHQVRNPRVGDRIDADLPHRLQEALPPVPEAAVADAAQPLCVSLTHRDVACRPSDTTHRPVSLQVRTAGRFHPEVDKASC